MYFAYQILNFWIQGKWENETLAYLFWCITDFFFILSSYSVAESQRMYAIDVSAAIKFSFYLATVSIYVSGISIFSSISKKKKVLLLKNREICIYMYRHISGVVWTEEIPSFKATKKDYLQTNSSHTFR